MTNFEKVGLFMTTFGQEVKKRPSLSSDKINKLRVNLIEEELNEFKDAIFKKDLKEAADALTDILYVTYGAGHAFGINLDKCFEEVRKSNMSKLDDKEFVRKRRIRNRTVSFMYWNFFIGFTVSMYLISDVLMFILNN